ncbi:MAG: sugar phosphate isomerase/epimerase [Clostridia bacterium]|nr:sugar phosphate isomerase/epimerase [Clostridia bacterium]
MKREPFEPGMSIWWPACGRLPSDGLMSRLRENNINWIETGIRQKSGSGKFQSHAERLEKIALRFREGGISVWSVHAPFGQEIDISNPKTAGEGIKLNAETIEACRAVGVDKVVIHGSSEPITERERPARIECCIESVQKLYHPDVKIALENLPRTCLGNTTGEMLAILKSLGGKVKCCIDVNHFHSGSIIDMIDALGGYLATVHISDDDGLDEKHWLPGQGVLDWTGILNKLREKGYKGVFMYEVQKQFAKPGLIRANYDMIIKQLPKATV